MKKRLVLLPADFELPFLNCPPGFFLCGSYVSMKTEYGNDEAYCDSGERFCAIKSLVTPLKAVWEEYED